MTGTRKQIIEIISKYMDKTLSEGCLILGNICNEDGIPIDDTPIEYKTFLHETDRGKSSSRYCRTTEGEYEIYKILGHYDITAVLKYIDKSLKDSRGFYEYEFLLELTQKDIHINIDDDTYMFPNKPLHLYTEQEEKDLLELLNKLGKI